MSLTALPASSSLPKKKTHSKAALHIILSCIAGVETLSPLNPPWPVVTSRPRLSSYSQGSQVPPLVPFTTISPNPSTSNHSCTQESTRHRQSNFLEGKLFLPLARSRVSELLVGMHIPSYCTQFYTRNFEDSSAGLYSTRAAYSDVQTRRDSHNRASYESKGRISPDFSLHYHTSTSSLSELIARVDKRYTSR
ncbi:hypothetical protein BKA61DRAFT_28955 [Leptodontidium sp. MPI-SDFR-AT-0119]|nr:hypothetical protein BKA61DRAFT_28955 [Leptodontidium sp. MPI-SDFR-AT-0119]